MKRILIAEDDEVSRMSLAELLRQQGYAVTTASDGHAAAEQVQRDDCDLVIADIRMAGNEKLELVRSCRTRALPLPVILVTGYPAVETAVAAIQLHVVGYLVKPVDFDELLRYIEPSLLRRHLYEEMGSMNGHLSEWRANLDRLKSVLVSEPRGSLSEPLEAYLRLTVENVTLAMRSLSESVTAVIRANQNGGMTDEMKGPTPLLVIHALRDAIDVLEKTKDSFRSKELADLRRRLERLLGVERKQAGAASTSSAPPGSPPATPR